MNARNPSTAEPTQSKAQSTRVAKSPYLEEANRLAEVIAAIQAMGTYKFYKLDFANWADRISGNSALGGHWRRVFEDHPEFFRLDGERKKASLVWRRQHQRRFHVDHQRVLSDEEYRALPEGELHRLSRVPLTPDDIRALVGTAIDLHQRAIEADRERRWWIPLFSAAGALVGAILGAILPLLFGG